MKRRKQDRINAGLPPWLSELLDAGRELTYFVERDVVACSTGPSHNVDCLRCMDRDNAIRWWARAVVAARKANAVRQRCAHRGCGYVTSSEFDKFCGACGSLLVAAKDATA